MNGTGPDAITQAQWAQFREGFEQAYQQTEALLDPYVERDVQRNDDQSYQRIGVAEDMLEDTTRFGDNDNSNIEHDVRKVSLRHFYRGKYIVDRKDLMTVITDPTNAYTQALLASGKRKRDDFIIEKYFDVARTGKEGDVLVSYTRTADDENDAKIRVGEISKGHSNPISTKGIYTLTGANTEGISVGANYDGTPGGTASGLTVEKLKGLRYSMTRVEAIQPETTIPLFVTSAQMRDLLAEDEVINSDYAVRKALAEGYINSFHGFNIRVCERLPLSSGSGGDERRCMAFLPRAFKLTIGEDLKGDIWMDTGKRKAPYVEFKQSIGGVRMWGEVAGEIRCLES